MAMAYHGIRPTSSSKQQKNDRLSEMSMQEQLIEKKKREIETKLAEQKRKEEEEALRKLQLKAKALAAAEENRAAMTAARQSARAMLNTKALAGLTNMPNNVNKFSNDGSFMDQFKNLQGVKMKFPPQGCGYQPGTSGSHGGNSNVLSMKLVNRNVQPTGLPVAKLSVFEEDDDEDADSRVSPAEDPPKPKVRVVEREAQQLMYTVPEVRETTVVKMEPLELPQNRFTYEDPTMYNVNYMPQRILEPYEIKRPLDEPIYNMYQSMCSGQLAGAMEAATGSSAPKKPRRSRWAPDDQKVALPPPVTVVQPGMNCTAPIGTDTTLIAYALKVFRTVELTQDHWKQLNDQLKMKALFEQLLAKKRAADRLARAGKNKYEYDSDEEQDGGTWEHKRRMEEMDKTKVMAELLTEMGRGKHHIGDFLPPDELERFMEKYDAIKNGRDPDLSDYKEFKIKEDNIGFKMLQKLGWEEGKGLGSDGSGITQPVNKAAAPVENSGLGQEKPADLQQGDDEYEAYRKRMMLAYRFRPNPLNNPRRPYY